MLILFRQKKTVSRRVRGRKRALHARQTETASAPFCATTFQKSGLKQIAATETQSDCLEKSIREERGGSEEAMMKTRAEDRAPFFTTSREDCVHVTKRLSIIDYVQSERKQNVGHGVMSYDEKLVKSNRWNIAASAKSRMTIPSLMACDF
jgi:hypothetical protein